MDLSLYGLDERVVATECVHYYLMNIHFESVFGHYHECDRTVEEEAYTYLIKEDLY